MATVDAKTSQQSLNMILAAVGMRESSQAVIQKRRKPSHLDRIPARELEQLVFSRLQLLLSSPQEMAAVYTESALPTSDLGRLIEAAQAMGQKWSELTSQQSAELLRGIIRRIVLRASEVDIDVDLEALERGLLHQDWNGSGDEGSKAPQGGNHLITLKCPFSLARRSGELRLVLRGSHADAHKLPSPLLKAILTAHGWRERIIAGEIYSIQQLASEAKLNSRYAARILRLAAMAPEIVDEIIHDTSMAGHFLSHFISGLPLNWGDQGSLLSQG